MQNEWRVPYTQSLYNQLDILTAGLQQQGAVMPAKLVKPKTTLGNIFGVVRAPLGFILDKIDEKNANNARRSI